jgi:hypothetical protein
MSSDPSNMPGSETLIRYIEYSGESDDIDAKGPVVWDNGPTSAALAKDFAAFANSRDGGALVIGKTEESPGKFRWDGLAEEQAASFDTTKVAAWVNNRFSPPIRLVCHRQEYQGKTFVVIVVKEFDDVPVLCVKSYEDPEDPKKHILREKTIYVRNANAESAPLGTIEELRALIGLATRKRGDEMLAHFDAMLKGRPLVPPASDREQFAKEITVVKEDLDLAKDGLWKQGAWVMWFHPAKHTPERWPELSTLEELIRRHRTRRPRGFPPSYVDPNRREWGIAYDYHGELWALTRTGLFFLSRTLWENREAFKSPSSTDSGQPRFEIPAGEWVEFEWSMGTIVEFFMFMSRFVQEYTPGEDVEYEVTASPLSGRRLVSTNPEIFREVPTPSRAKEYRYGKSLLMEELRANWKEECAIAMTKFFELLPSDHGYIQRSTLRQWVDRFVEGRV